MADHRADSPPEQQAPPGDQPTATSPDPGDDLASVAPEPEDSHPEPVLTRARYVQLVTSLLPLVLFWLAAAGVKITVDQSTLLATAIAAAGVVTAAVNWAWVRVQAWRTRAVVTPVVAPRGVNGDQLVSLRHARNLAATAAAQAAVTGRVTQLLIGQPAPTPWAQDVTVIPEENAA